MPFYIYVPIAHYRGATLKCKGILTDGNFLRLLLIYPGAHVTLGYHGDRIWASDHAAFDEVGAA